VQAEQRVGRQVVEKRGGRIEEQRQPVLDTGAGDTVRDIAVDRRASGIAFESFAKALPEAATRGAVERELARRQQTDLGDGIQRALAIDIEGLDVLDLVVEKIQAERQLRAHREKVDEAAADRVLARCHHLCHVRVAGKRHLGAEPLTIQTLALLQEEGIGREVGRRCKTADSGARRHEENVTLATCHRVQRRQALGNEVEMRREAVVGQRLPVGQQADP